VNGTVWQLVHKAAVGDIIQSKLVRTHGRSLHHLSNNPAVNRIAPDNGTAQLLLHQANEQWFGDKIIT
jgi:hypothetical protein